MNEIKTDKLIIEDFNKYKKGNWNVYILDSCASTLDIAKEKLKDGLANGTLIIADTQTGGRGRQARKWVSPRGGIWMSIVLKPKLTLVKLSSITLLCAVAAAKAMGEMFPQITLGIKWPNDIYINDKKVCGILTETVMENKNTWHVVVGIGINANNGLDYMDDDVKQRSISFSELGIFVDRAQLAALINDNLQELIRTYENSDDIGFILDYYHKHMQWINKEAVMKNTITGNTVHKGIVKGIDKMGQLLMENDGETLKIVSGELSLRREV